MKPAVYFGACAGVAALPGLLAMDGCENDRPRAAIAGSERATGRVATTAPSTPPPPFIPPPQSRAGADRGSGGQPAPRPGDVCHKDSYPGWEDLPLERCRYAVPDRNGTKHAEVILLNPSRRKLARWIANACRATFGKIDDICLHRLHERVRLQSSEQFPVAGIVLEDILPRDGSFEMYCFRHGVTVQVEGFVSGSTEPPDAALLATCLHGRVMRPRTYARLAGTTPSEYRANGGTVDVGTDSEPTMAWLAVSRDEYRSAWRSKRNVLMEAWARAHRDRLR